MRATQTDLPVAMEMTVLGYDPGWFTGERLTAITHPDYLPSVMEWMASVYKGPTGRVSRIEART